MAKKAASPRSGGCSVGVDLSDPALPVAGLGSLSRIRKSKSSRWRAGVLIGVHALVAAHVAHFMLAGKTLSPVEPSESMYTLELGYLNAGFVFFAIALLGTLVFGRFFCGWGCHLVALQDFCAWIMKRLGIRPKPFRSRLLVFVPLALALYMFVWPSVKRLVMPNAVPSFPGFTNHLITTSFWATFPGPLFTVLTFVSCGFAAVYFLGSKGFCTYGCPYGAAFGGLDRLSPGRIVVSDACEQCGHCTATCTSNVRVHDEVKLYGMVVDPGCMKCLDCVSVCPKEALSFSFARPAALQRLPAASKAKKYDLGLFSEILLLLTCLAATLAFRGLYDGPPLLMSVGLGAITAFVALMLVKVVREPHVRLQNLVLKSSGRVQVRGLLFAGVAALWLLFAAHSAFVQWHRARGAYYLEQTESTRADVLNGAFRERSYSPRHTNAVAAALQHFTMADRWGLVGVTEIKLGLAWCHLLEDDLPAAEANVRSAVAIRPDDAALQQNLLEILLAGGNRPAAIELLKKRVSSPTAPVADRFQLAGLLAESERLEEAAVEYAACVEAAPDSAPTRYNFGGLLRRLGRNVEAIEQLEVARQINPQDADTCVELGLAYMATGKRDGAIEAFQRAIALAPDSPESRLHLPGLIQQLQTERAGN